MLSSLNTGEEQAEDGGCGSSSQYPFRFSAVEGHGAEWPGEVRNSRKTRSNGRGNRW